MKYDWFEIKDGISLLKFQQLERDAIELAKIDAATAWELGQALVAVRDSMLEYGQFGPWLKNRKIDRNRAYYCMRVVEGKIPDKPAKDTPNQPTRKLFKDAVVKSFSGFRASSFSWKMPREELVKVVMFAAIQSVGRALVACGRVSIRSAETPEYKEKFGVLMKAIEELASVALVEPDAESKPVETATAEPSPNRATEMPEKDAVARDIAPKTPPPVPTETKSADDLPSDAEYREFVDRASKVVEKITPLVADRKVAGGLMKNYILAKAGVEGLKKVSRVQFASILESLEAATPEAVIQLMAGVQAVPQP